MRMTRADLRAKIARLEKRLAGLNVEAEEFDHRARYSGGEDEAGRAERAAARAQYDLWAAEISGVDRELRATWQALDTLVDALMANVLRACQAQSVALDALLQAECDARDAGEHELAAAIDTCRKALVRVGLGALHDSIVTTR